MRESSISYRMFFARALEQVESVNARQMRESSIGYPLWNTLRHAKSMDARQMGESSSG